MSKRDGSASPTNARSAYECFPEHYRRTPIRSEQNNQAVLASVSELALWDHLTQAEEELMAMARALGEKFKVETGVFL